MKDIRLLRHTIFECRGVGGVNYGLGFCVYDVLCT
jgi:hypothetical protein